MAITPVIKGVNTLVSVGQVEVGGQEQARLQQQVQINDITNNIKQTWKEIITSIKSWSVICSGMVIKDDEAYKTLKEAFQNNTIVTIKMTDGNQTMSGQAYVTSFPLNSVYNSAWKYAITFTGSGPLS